MQARRSFVAAMGRSSLPWQPHLEAEYDYATGNSHTNPDRIGTYDQEYPSNHNAFGLVDLFGFQNIKQRSPELAVDAAQRTSMTAAFKVDRCTRRQFTMASTLVLVRA